MVGVLTGFGIVGSQIALGILVSRLGILGEHGQHVLSRASFSLATPALMFWLLATSETGELFTTSLVVVAGTALLSMAAFVVIGSIARWGIERCVVGALASGYVNAGLGLPVATYVLGAPTLIAPVMLFQLIMLAPVSLSILDVAHGGAGGSWGRRLATPLRNPIVLASLAGLVVAISGVRLPGPVLEPFSMLGHATVPMMLIAFGMSLNQGGLPLRAGDRVPIAVAVTLKSLVAPVLATGLGLALGLAPADLMAAVLCAALPTAQNIFVYASRYGGATVLARDTVFVTTVLAVPVLIVGTVLLAAPA